MMVSSIGKRSSRLSSGCGCLDCGEPVLRQVQLFRFSILLTGGLTMRTVLRVLSGIADVGTRSDYVLVAVPSELQEVQLLTVPCGAQLWPVVRTRS